MRDRFYWFAKNGTSFVLNMLVFPIFLFMFTLESIYDGLRIVFRCDGSETLAFPWETEWPFFRSDE